MDLFIILGALAIFLYPFFSKKIDFLDIILIYFLYFDIMIVFIVHPPSFIYFENLLILIYSFYSFYKRGLLINSLSLPVFVFLILNILVPIYQGDDINQSFRIFSRIFSSIILLPLAISYYSNKNNLKKLFKSIYWFILLWCLFVIIATPFSLGGFQSERVGGNVFYFGEMAMRGGVTYISFFILSIPLILKSLKKYERYILIICSLFILIIFFAVLKRIVFVIILLGAANYLFKSSIKIRFKIISTFLPLIFLIILFNISFFTNMLDIRINERLYNVSRNKDKISVNALRNDIRIFEPFYVLENLREKKYSQILFGSKERAIMDLNHYGAFYQNREIHNTYATMVMKLGIIGLFFYLLIFYKVYIYVYNLKKKLVSKNLNVGEYWILFQNLFFCFLIEGIVGGHTHTTYRGFIFLLFGAICGYFYNLNRSKDLSLNDK